MRKLYLSKFILFSIFSAEAQVGIGTSDPKATLQIVGKPNEASAIDGVIAPRITRAELIAKTGYTSANTGSIIYVTDLSGTTNSATGNVLQTGYYYFNGNSWSSMNASGTGFSYGDVKTGIQTSDHNGWVKLNGREKSSLTATQQTVATALGIGLNLPDATDAFLVQNGSGLGTVTGSNSKTVNQENLPNITLSGSTSNNGAHDHTGTTSENTHNHTFSVLQNSGSGSIGINPLSNGQGFRNFNANNNSHSHTFTTSTATSHNHTITTSSLNGGVTQSELNITPKSLSINVFIYLGE